MSSIVTPENNIFIEANKINPASRLDIDYPCILIAGQTGTGKTRSIKNLPPEKTIIFNLESKPLTFSGSDAFRGSEIRFSYSEGDIPGTMVYPFENKLIDTIKRKDIKYIVIDSFSKYVDLLLNFSKATNKGKGYEIFNYYNDKIFNLLEIIKRNKGKFIIITALDELVSNQHPNGMITNSRRVKVAGKVWEASIESQFSIVLFTEILQPQIGSNDRPKYKFVTFSDGTTSTKTPEEMFKDKYIDNDVKIVCDNCEKYFKLE